MKLSVAHVTRRVAAMTIAAALLLPVIGVAPVAACDQGCTPGYWKNHTDMWGNYSPNDTLIQVGFVDAGSYAGVKMIDALQYAGGPGVDGATRIMLRAAVASLLNGTLTGGLATNITLLNANDALRSGNRDFILSVATFFDGMNNLYCPY